MADGQDQGAAGPTGRTEGEKAGMPMELARDGLSDDADLTSSPDGAEAAGTEETAADAAKRASEKRFTKAGVAPTPEEVKDTKEEVQETDATTEPATEAEAPDLVGLDGGEVSTGTEDTGEPLPVDEAAAAPAEAPGEVPPVEAEEAPIGDHRETTEIPTTDETGAAVPGGANVNEGAMPPAEGPDRLVAEQPIEGPEEATAKPPIPPREEPRTMADEDIASRTTPVAGEPAAPGTPAPGVPPAEAPQGPAQEPVAPSAGSEAPPVVPPPGPPGEGEEMVEPEVEPREVDPNRISIPEGEGAQEGAATVEDEANQGRQPN